MLGVLEIQPHRHLVDTGRHTHRIRGSRLTARNRKPPQGTRDSQLKRHYGISILIKRYSHVVLEHIRLQRCLHSISFMVDSHSCWAIRKLPCQAMQNRRLMMKGSSSYNQSERKQPLRCMTELSRIKTLEINSSNHISFKRDNGY